MPPKNKKKIAPLDSKQKTIIDFFRRPVNETKPKAKVNKLEKKNGDECDDDVIVLSDSDEDEKPSCSKRLKLMKNEDKRIFSSYFTPPSSQEDENSTTQETAEGSLNSSDDEMLSQLDMDEIIASSSESTPVKEVLSQNSQMILTPPLINKTPIKLPKNSVNSYSPLRHLSQGSSSSKKSKISPLAGGTPSPAKFPSNSQQITSSIIKKLEFSDRVQSQSHSEQIQLPYYLRFFLQIVNSVSNDPFHCHLFDEEDKIRFKVFEELDTDAKCLYVRLFQRKWQWKVGSTLKYPQIRENLHPLLEKLRDAGLLVEVNDVKDELELEVVLSALTAEQTNALAKQMNIPFDKENKTKKACIEKLLKLAHKQTNKLFGTLISTSDAILKRALKILGPTYQVEGNFKKLFSRCFILHAPPQYWDENETSQSSQQHLKKLLEEQGQMIYPKYNINRQTPIYKTKEDLVRFQDAWTSHSNIASYMESKNWKQVVKVGNECIEIFTTILNDSSSSDQNLPTFLRVYTAASVLTRILWLSVDGHEKLRDYEAANVTLRILLQQDLYFHQYRGRWYERLAINSKHLKVPNVQQILELEHALSDRFLLATHKLSLSERLEKINKNTDSEILYKLQHEVPTRIITGEKLYNPNLGKSSFINPQNNTGTVSVEVLAIDHYITSQGYSKGIHAEGSVVCSIFGLLFWDEIYTDEIADTFHSKNQPFPLDLNFDEFFMRRESIFEDKINGMRNSWTIDDAINLLQENWSKHCNCLSIVKWEVFAEVETAISLVKAMGLSITASICERLCKNFRHWRSGFPDLVLFNDAEFMFVEVKGPGDSLSFKQKVWLDFLQSIGAKAEVCHVKDVSNKRINIKD